MTRRLDSSSEFFLIWNVGKSLWQRDLRSAYGNIDCRPWTFTYGPVIMCCLREAIRDRQIMMIGKSFSSITLEALAADLGITSVEGTKDICTANGWDVDAVKAIAYPRAIVPSIASGMVVTGNLLDISDEESDVIMKLSRHVAQLERSLPKVDMNSVDDVAGRTR